ncbi:MAG: CBS domain-containing protein [Polyangia bacterium]
MKIGDVMSTNSVRILEGASFEEAAARVSDTGASDLMVVRSDGTFVGVLSEGDLIRATLPEYDDLMRDGAPVGGAWKVFLEKGREKRGTSIAEITITSPVTFRSTEDLIKAASTMINKQIRILPVVDDGKLVGTISRGDLCKAVLRGEGG